MDHNIEVRGAAIISNNIISGRGRLKWCVRRNPTSIEDTGWIFLSEIDNDEFCSKKESFTEISYVDIFDIEPSVLWIYNLPIGTDIQLVIKNGKRFYVDNITGKKIKI